MVLTGTAASGGVCSGRARRVTGVVAVEWIQPGEILVLSSLTSDLLPLMAVVGAVIVEAAGALEGMIATARAFGLPMVIGIARAMRVIDEGDRVTVDGFGGVVLVQYT